MEPSKTPKIQEKAFYSASLPLSSKPSDPAAHLLNASGCSKENIRPLAKGQVESSCKVEMAVVDKEEYPMRIAFGGLDLISLSSA